MLKFTYMFRKSVYIGYLFRVSVFVIFMEDYLTDRSPSLTMTNKVVSVIGSGKK